MANPNPARITEPVWQCWLGCQAAIPGVRYGGTYVNKRCYHGTRADNQRSWPGAYCIKLSLDLQGPSDKTAAIDLTMSDAEMRKRTGYLRNAAAANDPRLAAVREFYGTLDSRSVYGRSKGTKTGSWRPASADSSHLWHIHISIFRAFVTSWAEIAPIVSVLSGQSLAQWRANPTVPGVGSGISDPHIGGIMLPSEGDSGPDVEYWQRVLTRTGEKLPKYGHDAGFGGETTAAVNSSRAKIGWDPVKPGRITAAHAVKLHEKAYGGGTVSAAQIAAEVAKYLKAHPPEPGKDGKTPTEVVFTGLVTKAE